jgi:hypothetical protein
LFIRASLEAGGVEATSTKEEHRMNLHANAALCLNQRLSGNYLAEFDRALEWAEMGRNSDSADTLDPLADAPDPAIPGVERNPAPSPDSSAG